MLDPKSKEVLETILTKDSNSLTENEIGFLNARRDYLNDDQKEKFADVIVSDDETSTKKKRSKKSDDEE